MKFNPVLFDTMCRVTFSFLYINGCVCSKAQNAETFSDDAVIFCVYTHKAALIEYLLGTYTRKAFIKESLVVSAPILFFNIFIFFPLS